MDILSVNANQKVTHIAASIGRNPLSWQHWFSLHLHLEGIDDALKQECFIWTKSIVDSYFQAAEGRVYFCENDIHVICKNVSEHVLVQGAQQICDLVYNECANNVLSYALYDLSEQGFLYAKNVLEQSGNIFSMPVSVHAGLGDIAGEQAPTLRPIKSGKPIMNCQDYTKVLLIEDDPVTRWMVRNALKHECHFATATSTNTAFSMYNSYQPDVVFLDINLPDGNGYTVLEWIMRNDPGACVVMFSSNDNLDNISSALDEGASGFIAKPFLKEQLLHYVQKH